MSYVKDGSIIRQKKTSEHPESNFSESVPPPYAFSGRGHTLGGDTSRDSFFENLKKKETKKAPSKSGLLAIETKKAAEQKMKPSSSKALVQKNDDEWEKILNDPSLSSGRSAEEEKQFQIGLYMGLSSSSSSRHSG